jgi:hypothetical protein
MPSGLQKNLSQDTYQLDRYKHGGAHVDRYNKQGQLVGRYTLTGTPIKHKGVFPPPIPNADLERFRKVASGE